MADRIPVHPHQHVPLPRTGGPRFLEALELFTPIALGQRAVVVGPPGSGKTTIVREMARSFAGHAPQVETHVVLIDQRPEEFAEWRAELPHAHVHGTSSDASPQEHVEIDAVFSDAADAAAAGRDLLIVIDSLANLARALNATLEPSDRVLTGGLLATALQQTRLRFALGRAYEPDGSLTVIATAAIDTGAELDEIVFQELVGTGNMEIRLLAPPREAGIFPPLDLTASGTRREEDILGHDEADARARLRAKVAGHGDAAGMSLLLHELDRYGSLDELLALHRG